MTENTVTMGLASYNQIKAENTRWQMFMSRIWEGAELRGDYSGLTFNVEFIEELIHIMYPDSYKKKLSTLRAQQTKLILKKLTLNEKLEDCDEENQSKADIY